ncbi:MAG TPA: T9SS type A sorting domain-containing protein [bacterium]|nr:T9SS type A sorting domain-containing protein [bacterium]HPN46175.1 T9SS type A sorting domain-containing protein [bacterium]
MKLLRISVLIIFLTLLATETWAQARQGHYRWRNDNGNDSTATWCGIQDDSIFISAGTNIRLRIELFCEMNGFSDSNIKLAYSVNNSNGPWTAITTDGSVNAFKIALSPHIADGRLTFNEYLTNSCDPFFGFGRITDAANSFAVALSESTSYEFEWCLQATVHVVSYNAYYFRVIKSDNSSLTGYNHYPVVSVENSLPVALAAFTAQQQGKNVQLNWTTASETNNLGFILERRSSQTDWQTIASYQTDAALQGKGNTTTNTGYTYTDTNAPQNAACEYRLCDVDIHGAVAQIGSTQLNVAAIPTAFVLEPAYPNPFNPATNIRFHLAQDGLVKLTVLDMLGRAVKTIDNTWLPAGSYTRTWNAVNDYNQSVTGGVYFFRLETANTNLVQKAVLIR